MFSSSCSRDKSAVMRLLTAVGPVSPARHRSINKRGGFEALSVRTKRVWAYCYMFYKVTEQEAIFWDGRYDHQTDQGLLQQGSATQGRQQRHITDEHLEKNQTRSRCSQHRQWWGASSAGLWGVGPNNPLGPRIQLLGHYDPLVSYKLRDQSLTGPGHQFIWRQLGPMPPPPGLFPSQILGPLSKAW